MICPIFHGGGVCVKLAEALYNGVPLLATSFATRGFFLQSDPALRILDAAEEWVEFLSARSSSDVRQVRIAPALANRFAASGYVEMVHQFLLQTPPLGELTMQPC